MLILGKGFCVSVITEVSCGHVTVAFNDKHSVFEFPFDRVVDFFGVMDTCTTVDSTNDAGAFGGASGATGEALGVDGGTQVCIFVLGLVGSKGGEAKDSCHQCEGECEGDDALDVLHFGFLLIICSDLFVDAKSKSKGCEVLPFEFLQLYPSPMHAWGNKRSLRPEDFLIIRDGLFGFYSW